MSPQPRIPEPIEDHRDAHWWREGTRQIETVLDATMPALGVFQLTVRNAGHR